MQSNNWRLFESVKQKRITEVIAEKILSLIESGELKAGDKLPSQKELVKLLGVSLPTVREALVGLSMLGHIEPHAGQGYFVRTPDRGRTVDFSHFLDDISEARIKHLYDARAVLECEITGLAAQRASEEDITRLYRWVDEIEQALPTEEALDRGLYFHLAVAETTKNEYLIGLERSLLDEFDKFKSHIFVEEATYDRDVVLHRHIVDTIVEGDFLKAREAALKHLHRFSEEVGIYLSVGI